MDEKTNVTQEIEEENIQNVVEMDESLALNEEIKTEGDHENIGAIDAGPEQIEAQALEALDRSEKSFYKNSILGRIGRALLHIFDPILWIGMAIRNMLLTAGMDSEARQKYFKEMADRAEIMRKEATKETPYVANKKMEILNRANEGFKLSEKDRENIKTLGTQNVYTMKRIEELAKLCYETGCTFHVVLQDKSAIEFRKNEKYVEMLFSEKPHKLKGNEYETYVFGTPFGNIKFKDGFSGSKAVTVNVNTVVARVSERGGFNTQIDTLKQNAQVVELSNFTKKKDVIELDESINPGHEENGKEENAKEELTREEPVEELTEERELSDEEKERLLSMIPERHEDESVEWVSAEPIMYPDVCEEAINNLSNTELFKDKVRPFYPFMEEAEHPDGPYMKMAIDEVGALTLLAVLNDKILAFPVNENEVSEKVVDFENGRLVKSMEDEFPQNPDFGAGPDYMSEGCYEFSTEFEIGDNDILDAINQKCEELTLETEPEIADTVEPPEIEVKTVKSDNELYSEPEVKTQVETKERVTVEHKPQKHRHVDDMER